MLLAYLCRPTDMPVIHGLSDDERELLTAPVDLPELEGELPVFILLCYSMIA